MVLAERPMATALTVCGLIAVLLVSAQATGVADEPVGEAARGLLMTCVIDPVNQPYAIPKQVVIQLEKLQDSYNMRKKYKECFSGGRGYHRSDMLYVPPNLAKSLDWKVTTTVVGKYVEDMITISAYNYRSEAILYTLNTTASNTQTSPALPTTVMIAAEAKRDVAVFRPIQPVKPGSTDVWIPDFYWRAEPLVFRQVPRSHQLYSNGVYLMVEHKRFSSIFSVYNERDDVDAPVYFTLDIFADEEVDPSNIVKTVATPVRSNVMPKSKATNVLTVSAKDKRRPWSFVFDFKWNSGMAPLAVFGQGSYPFQPAL